MPVYNIDSNYSFPHCLAKFILDKYASNQKPFFMANIKIFLPTNRACSRLKEVFLELSSTQATILPEIKPITEVASKYEKQNNNKKAENSAIKYTLLIANEIKKLAPLISKKAINYENAIKLAMQIEPFLDEAIKADIDLVKLNQVVDKYDLPQHSQNMLQFLIKLDEKVKKTASKYNIISKTTAQINQINQFNDHVKNNPPPYPIIIAGTMATVKATANLIKTITTFENCHFIFNSLAKNLPKEIKESDAQFHNKKLLDSLKISRQQVEDLHYPEFQKFDDELFNLIAQKP